MRCTCERFAQASQGVGTVDRRRTIHVRDCCPDRAVAASRGPAPSPSGMGPRACPLQLDHRRASRVARGPRIWRQVGGERHRHVQHVGGRRQGEAHEDEHPASPIAASDGYDPLVPSRRVTGARPEAHFQPPPERQPLARANATTDARRVRGSRCGRASISPCRIGWREHLVGENGASRLRRHERQMP